MKGRGEMISDGSSYCLQGHGSPIAFAGTARARWLIVYIRSGPRLTIDDVQRDEETVR